MTAPALTSDQNLLPVQAYFDVFGKFQTFIGQGQPFYATVNPSQSGLNITNSTINSTTIGLVTPSSGIFTNIQTTTGSVSTTPVNPTDIVNKSYVDAYLQGLSFKAPAQVATTANITLSGLQTIDGYTTLVGDRVLVKNQTTQQNNGIYLASASAWTRSSDAATYAELVAAFLFIENGTSQTGSAWVSTIPQNGTLGVTPITFTQFSNTATYTAGTGLTLSNYQFSITPVGTAGTYGSASNVPVFVTNASGQVTSVTNTSISIAPSQINATIPNSGLTNSSITVNGTNIALGGSGTITATASNALTIGAGLSGTSYNGSTPVTIAIDSTVVTLTGSQTLTNKTLTAPVISTITNVGTLTLPTSTDTLVGRATTDTLTNKSIAASTNTITGLTNSNLSGTAGITNGNLANSSVTVNGTAISLGGSGTVTANTPNSVTFNSSGTGGASPTSFNGGAAVTVSYNTLGASPLAGSSSLTTVGTIASGTWNGSVIGLSYGGTNANLTANAGGIVYSGASALAISAAGSTGQYLQSNGTGAPTWSTPSASVSISDQTLSSSTFYPTFVNATSGTTSTIDTSSTKLQYVPSTGTLTSTAFSGSGASLTSLTAGNLSGTIPSAVLGNSTVYIGTTAILLNRASGSISLTGTNIDGSAGSATTATTATNALNVQVTDNTSSSSTFYPTLSPGTTGSTNYALGTSSTKLSFVPNTGTLTTTALVSTGGSIDNTPIGATTANTGKFTTLEATGTSTLGDASTTYIQVLGDASYPAIKAAGGTNTPLVLQPLGTGALQAQKTDSTTTGGNARGANAVDWQTSRNVAAGVASGQLSVVVGGYGNRATAYASVVSGGYLNTESNNGFVGGGSTNSQTGTYGFIGAGTVNNIGSLAYGSVIAGGSTNTVNGFFNGVLGGFTNSGTSGSAATTQSGTMNGTTAVTLSGSNANIKVGQLVTGTYITYPTTYVAAISGTSLTLSQVASGSGTSTLSFYTPHGVVVGGGNNQATGAYSFIGGGGDAGVAANRNVASGDWSAILGGRGGTTRGITGYQAFPACSIPIASGAGYSQGGLLVLGTQTTNATATVITSDGLVASTSNQVILPNNSAYFFRGEVIAGVTGGGNTKGWTIEGVIKRGAGVGTTALVGTPTVTSLYADAGAATWTITATADTTNGGLAITFTGQAATTIRTVCQIRTTEMTY